MKRHHWICGLLLGLILLSGCGDETTAEMPEKRAPASTVNESTVTTSEMTTTVSAPTTTAVTTVNEEEQAFIALNHSVTALLETMTIEEKVGQLFYISVPTYNKGNIPAGGVIFFKPDLAGRENLTHTIEVMRSKVIQPFIGIDEEGGIISRLSGGDYGVPEVPSAWEQAHSSDANAVEDNSRFIAEGLEQLGFNMNFAPVADIHTNPDNPVIGHRAYSDRAVEVSKYVVQSLKGYENTRVIPVVKHFPGHGDTHGDSHHNSVYIDGDLPQLKSRELMPFQAAVDAGVDVVMMGHIRVPEVSGELPASLSEVIIKDVLRDEMGFSGLVISDSLIMKGITDSYSHEEILELGLSAGLDMILIPENPEEGYQYLVERVKADPALEEKVDEAVRRILTLKMNHEMISE